MLILYILLGIQTLVFIWLIRQEIRLHTFFRGSKAASFENTISKIVEDVKNLESFKKESIASLQIFNERLAQSIRGVGLVRFNPFQGTGSGSNQSFAIAFIDEDGNGIVISSLYSRERVSTFAKPIKKFSSKYELSEEEKTALQQAKEHIIT